MDQLLIRDMSISALAQPPAAAPGTDRPALPVQILCFDSLPAIACLWTTFQSRACATAYHSYQWAEAWQSTIGARLGAKPRILVGLGERGEPVFILPLQLRKRRGLRVLEWHGSPDTPYGHGLFLPAFLAEAPEWFALRLDQVLAKAGDYDLLKLINMPQSLFGAPHPFARAFNVTGANESYQLNLSPAYGDVYARKRNAETRRASRRKDSRLAEMGSLEFRRVTDPSELASVLDTMLDHKIARLAAEGVHGVFEADDCAMVHRLAIPTQGPAIFTTHVLTLDGEILACTFGGWLRGTYWFYISSIAPETAATRHSPGDYALRRTIEECCTAGLTAFDFGAGSAPYKIGWTDNIISLHCIIRASRLRALPDAAYESGKLWAKALIKRRPRLKNSAFRLRRLLRAGKAARS